MSSNKSQVSRLGLLKGKSCSSSVPSFSIRYNAEDDEVEQLGMSTKSEEVPENGSPVSIEPTESFKQNIVKKPSLVSKLDKRTGSLEEVPTGEPWRIFTEFTGRITKTVEEKLEEIKSDRLKGKKTKEERTKSKLTSNSSISDSEEKSEASSSFANSSSPEKSTSEKTPQDLTVEDTDAGDVSDSLDTPDRATTPIVTEMDVSDSTPLKEIQSIGYNKKGVFFNQGTETDYIPPKPRGLWRRFKKSKSTASSEPEVGVEAMEADIVKPISSSEPFRREEEKPCLLLQSPSRKVSSKKKFFLRVFKWWPAFLPCFLAIAYQLWDLPPLWFGILIGILVSIEAIYFFTEFRRVFYFDDKRGHYNSLCSSFSMDRLHSVFTDAMFLPPTSQPENIIYEGWINEFAMEYQPETYHVTLTETVYVTLQGSVMKLSTPRQKIPKRAFWSEPRYKLRFNRERLYNISNCTVCLLPEGLTHKRIWSKKYPICIKLQPHSHLGVRYREKGQNTVSDSTMIFPELKSSQKETLKVYIGISDAGRADDLSQESNEEEKTGDLKELDCLTLPSTSKNDRELSGLILEDDDEDEDQTINDFVQIPTAVVNKSHLYLFARTDREKDIWFRRLVAATTHKTPNEPVIEEESPLEPEIYSKSAKEVREEMEVSYMEFMKFVGQITNQGGRPKRRKSSGNIEKEVTEKIDNMWVNSFVGRILFDTLKDPYWIKKIQDKIQRKISTIKIPVFMEELIISNLEFTDNIPLIMSSELPVINECGLWIDLGVKYNGTFKMTIDTKLNLMKLKKNAGASAAKSDEGGSSQETSAGNESGAKSAIFDSSMEDSAESSSGDPPDIGEISQKNPLVVNSGPKVLKMVDKIAASRYFQQVTDNKYVKRALEGVSSTNISLLVELKGLEGTLVLNFPPPPSDRLWYGFRPKTKLLLSAQPKWGSHAVTVLNIASWIEKKLCREFEKILVIPNMDDLVVPLMSREHPI